MVCNMALILKWFIALILNVCNSFFSLITLWSVSHLDLKHQQQLQQKWVSAIYWSQKHTYSYQSIYSVCLACLLGNQKFNFFSFYFFFYSYWWLKACSKRNTEMNVYNLFSCKQSQALYIYIYMSFKERGKEEEMINFGGDKYLIRKHWHACRVVSSSWSVLEYLVALSTWRGHLYIWLVNCESPKDKKGHGNNKTKQTSCTGILSFILFYYFY